LIKRPTCEVEKYDVLSLVRATFKKLNKIGGRKVEQIMHIKQHLILNRKYETPSNKELTMKVSVSKITFLTMAIVLPAACGKSTQESGVNTVITTEISSQEKCHESEDYTYSVDINAFEKANEATLMTILKGIRERNPKGVLVQEEAKLTSAGAKFLHVKMSQNKKDTLQIEYYMSGSLVTGDANRYDTFRIIEIQLDQPLQKVRGTINLTDGLKNTVNYKSVKNIEATAC
jgi:hypothetical protein